ncbi:kdo(2)-lipid A phosphoethanolamine 7''-transferase [Chitiniphilus eburneus]|uniref:Kdo(2)-lipid A phosphoethanolamine 7''-transferase n=1 Tax=Chitiniphilus eburneus TaxID=2571148 RepID=A0A4U0PDH3_9NEIS|nr:kdo(2)-lipid A phosphoethanolamine 7''-transferase [Chitiniphilus eburneus]TJZ65801.1 kdo(2)-lipid A phosphoethanolamine 7''-transferase [Chitiniphilus eburneus]
MNSIPWRNGADGRVRALSQSWQAWWLALYIGVLLNGAVFYRRFDQDLSGMQTPAVLVGAIEVIAVVLLNFVVLRLLSLAGSFCHRVLASLLVLVCVAASYYMTCFNVVIGYGIVASVLTTDFDLSREVVGLRFVGWIVLLSAGPLWWLWRARPGALLSAQLRCPRQGVRALTILLLAALLVWLPVRWVHQGQRAQDAVLNRDTPSYGGVVAHSYLPANWLAALGLYAYAALDERRDARALFDPVEAFTYVAPQGIEETYVVFIVGETARWDHLGLLGYVRDTTPLLAREPNLVAFAGTSCDTATKLSLRCMFVREGGAKDNAQRTVTERNVFAVLHDLGFSGELFAMQSELWFYNKTDVDDFAFREMIASAEKNQGRAVDDMLLIDELKGSLARHPQGQHLVILHTKGSHHQYSQRYPRQFARYQPECAASDGRCDIQALINAFDNSILYTDHFIKQVLDQLRDKRALVFYASDHGESISDDTHLHGTPREVAPPEQFRVPLLVWGSERFLSDKHNADAFERMRTLARAGTPQQHTDLFDSILGCLGYTSPDGGIDARNNWCAPKDTVHAAQRRSTTPHVL